MKANSTFYMEFHLKHLSLNVAILIGFVNQTLDVFTLLQMRIRCHGMRQNLFAKILVAIWQKLKIVQLQHSWKVLSLRINQIISIGG